MVSAPARINRGTLLTCGHCEMNLSKKAYMQKNLNPGADPEAAPDPDEPDSCCRNFSLRTTKEATLMYSLIASLTAASPPPPGWPSTPIPPAPKNASMRSRIVLIITCSLFLNTPKRLTYSHLPHTQEQRAFRCKGGRGKDRGLILTSKRWLAYLLNKNQSIG